MQGADWSRGRIPRAGWSRDGIPSADWSVVWIPIADWSGSGWLCSDCRRSVNFNGLNGKKSKDSLVCAWTKGPLLTNSEKGAGWLADDFRNVYRLVERQNTERWLVDMWSELSRKHTTVAAMMNGLSLCLCLMLSAGAGYVCRRRCLQSFVQLAAISQLLRCFGGSALCGPEDIRNCDLIDKQGKKQRVTFCRHRLWHDVRITDDVTCFLFFHGQHTLLLRLISF